ncbi:MAG: hypothetical protein ABJA89_08310 [Lapillicoccus sp.]
MLAPPLLVSADGAPAGEGFSVTNLLLVLLVLAVAWPAYQWLRRTLSRRRRERWQREGLIEEDGFTRDTDPDLRRDDETHL